MNNKQRDIENFRKSKDYQNYLNITDPINALLHECRRAKKEYEDVSNIIKIKEQEQEELSERIKAIQQQIQMAAKQDVAC